MSRLPFSLLLIIFPLSHICYGQVLSGVDDLGRVLPQNSVVGDPVKNRQVGMFYFLWQGDARSKVSERSWDLTDMYEKNPAIFKDFHHPGWGGGSGIVGRYYFWGESVYGYYRGDDYWVHLKNIQLLTDAGVDFLVIDATNRLIYEEQSAILFKAIEAVRKQRKNPPKVVYYTNTASGAAMQDIYNKYYKEGAPYRYPDSWFYLDEKPLIIGVSKEATGSDYAGFFTFRESQWPNEKQKVNGWPWIEFQRPQHVYTNHKGEREIVNVSAAQHPNLEASMGGSAFYGKAGNWGRSFRNNAPGDPSADLHYGYNIQEQWDFAIQQNVPFVFVTGWNEWVAGKWRSQSKDTSQSLFVDQASPEYSRDIEPSLTAGLRDHYYMQLVANIRRYKGIDDAGVIYRQDKSGKSIYWDRIPVAYQDYIGDVLHRDHPAATSEPLIVYKNTSGRNDIDNLKVVAGRDRLHFFVRTVGNLTSARGDNWMTLWLNTDASCKSGWLGYDYRVVKGHLLQRYVNNSWQSQGSVKHSVDNNSLVLEIPYRSLGLPAGNFSIEMKWSDNMQNNDPLDWYVNGDAAPGGRFNLLLQMR
ncbi:hypothetical protein [Niabella hibiscisoli]|uniref:hypothetical protein n=1 Tax=Niabella hibiscisoli TaxID=1825928 RepID=UPI001F114A08|nr:hypothetical protein [Niabella hibiscisoli]MCH5719081.1 hypothetical protein [Niabella hibiscisoli]